MALFFDADWFDARLGERGLSRAVMAAAAAMRPEDLALAFKDQREISAGEVAVFAELLGVEPAEVAARVRPAVACHWPYAPTSTSSFSKSTSPPGKPWQWRR